MYHLYGKAEYGVNLVKGNLIRYMNEFVYGDSERIFVNTSIGCSAKCVYCYLPDLDIKKIIKRMDVNEVIKRVEGAPYYRRGSGGSLISIGCYSECMDSKNIEDTFKVVNYFLQQDNYVQLATKKEIDDTFFKSIILNGKAKEKLWIYVSIPTITDSAELEPGTDVPEKRIKNFELCKKYGIHNALYIKPYLSGVTDKDVNRYIELIKEYDFPVVVGGTLSVNNSGIEVSVGEKRLYEYELERATQFINQLKSVTKVYFHSTECIR